MSWQEPPTERSYSTCGEMVRHCRQQRGWTQEDLAGHSGLSVRLIAKAEAGGSLQPDSIELLARVFSQEKSVVSPEDLMSSPKALATTFHRAYCEYEEKLVSKCRHFLAEDMQAFVPGGPPAAPLSGLHEGIEAFDEFCHNFFTIFERPDKELAARTATITADGNQVFVNYYDRVLNEHIPSDAPAVPVVLHMLFSQGKLVSIQHLFDTTTIGPVVTMWREKQKGIVNHDHLIFFDPHSDGKNQ